MEIAPCITGTSTEAILTLPCHLLEEHPLRLSFYSQAHLAGLTASIKENGLFEPVLVCPLDGGKYRILSGHYRVRAVRRLRQPEILCRVYNCDSRMELVIYCTSNLLTRGLSAIEEAFILATLVKDEGFTMESAGKLWGRSKSWVSRRIKLLTDLDPQIKKELGQGNLGPRLAQELARLPRGNQQERVLAIIRRFHLNKDEAAKLIDLWQGANEEERCYMEEAGLFRPPPHVKKEAQEGAGKEAVFVMKSLNRCTIIINELITLLKQGEIMHQWWPAAQYYSFLESVDILTRLLPQPPKEGVKQVAPPVP